VDVWAGGWVGTPHALGVCEHVGAQAGASGAQSNVIEKDGLA
jgi:hypothetical protein